MTDPGGGDLDWFYNEESRALYGSMPGWRIRVIVATDVMPEVGRVIADVMNAAGGPNPVSIPSPANPADPVSEGLAVVVTTGAPLVQLLACTGCGVLLWDVEGHWRDVHASRLAALRGIRARE